MLVAGTFLVPALSLRDALIAIVVGGVVGNAMLGVAGAIGAQARVPAMVLMRAPLGHRGSYLATGLNVLQNLGWAVFELIIIAAAAAALSDRVVRVRGEVAVDGRRSALVAAALALAGPDRLRPPVGAALRLLGRARVARLPHVVDARPRRPRRALGRSRATASRSGSGST